MKKRFHGIVSMILLLNIVSMRYSYNSSSLSAAKQQLLEDHSAKRFKKIERLLNHHEEYTIKINAEESKGIFHLKAKLLPNNLIITQSDRDIKHAINLTANQMQRKLREEKEKFQKRRKGDKIKFKFKEYLEKISSRFEI